MSLLLFFSGASGSSASVAGSATLTAHAVVIGAIRAPLVGSASLAGAPVARAVIAASLAGSAAVGANADSPLRGALAGSASLTSSVAISIVGTAAMTGVSALTADVSIAKAPSSFSVPTPRLQWPATILSPRKVMVDPVYATISAGRSITGIEQVIAGDAGYWAITLDEIPCARQVQKQAARALSVQLNGRLGTIDIPLWDQKNAPGWMASSLVPFGDQAPFSDDSLFSSDAPISAIVASDVALGANSMTIDLIVGTTLQPGQHFSVMGATSKQRLFRIVTATFESGMTWLVSVWPPAREAISADTLANFNDPRCTCRLKTDAEMMTFVDDYAGRTLAKVDFEEALP